MVDMVDEKIANNIRLALGLLSLVFIICRIPYFSDGFVYDEPHYLSNVEVINQWGLGSEFIKNLKGPAGPLHAYLHYFIYPLTQGDVFYTRIINVLLGSGIVFFLYKILSLSQQGKGKLAMLLFSIPMTFSAFGIAHTEVPAMFFYTLFLWVTFYIYKQNKRSLLLILLASVFMSLAITGRQPYLVCLGGLLPFCWASYKNEKFPTAYIMIGILSLLMPLYLFYTWGGIAPVIGRSIVTKDLVSPFHFILSLGYAAVVMLLLAPDFFLRLTKKQLLIYIISLPICIGICVAGDFSFIVMYTTVKAILPASLLPFAGNVMAAALMVVGIYFIHSLLARCTERPNDHWLHGVCIAAFLLLLTNMMVTHIFSTRYIFQAAPLFIIIASYFSENSWRDLSLNTAGVALGMLSFLMYE